MKIRFLDIPAINRPYHDEFHAALQVALDEGSFILGEEVRAFEKEYAGFIGTDYCTGVANGLDALRLIFKAYIQLGLMKPGMR